MRKCVFTVIAISCITYAQHPVTARLWSYVSLTGLVSPQWAVVIMPGARYEFYRSEPQNGVSKKFYFYECLAGPVYIAKKGSFTFKLPLWYYYMGYPVEAADEHYLSHNIEFLPIIQYTKGNLKLASRTIFHNTIFASIYETNRLKHGYGLVLRQLLGVNYSVTKNVNLNLAVEPFFGIIEDKEADPHVLGYWRRGFSMNRIYVGFDLKIHPRLSFSLQHVFESTYDTYYDTIYLSGVNHYGFITVSYIFKLFY